MLLTGCASFTTGLSIGAFGCPSAMVLALLGGAPRGELNPDTAIITLALLLLSWLMAPAASSWLLAALGMACCAEWARQRLVSATVLMNQTLLWSIRFRLRKLPKAWLNVVGHALTGVVAVVATRSMWAE
ncbi:MAG: uncharacterized protein KVP18_001024 [Porospora cf. gigantea A]|uniref:uncharacterized protein n=1 Tax=Porospora cf. gigantea A TaxID=2853593 RepID=UPI00355A0492|nr:MAG: hypothetical protein KVP18_001024 [Porospora cf. gigantea A]